MRTGDVVLYGDGKALVAFVEGTGASGKNTLCLDVGGRLVRHVAHEEDTHGDAWREVAAEPVDPEPEGHAET